MGKRHNVFLMYKQPNVLKDFIAKYLIFLLDHELGPIKFVIV